MSRAINPITNKKRQWGKMWTKVRGLVIERDRSYHGGVATCEYCGAVEGGEVVITLKTGEEVKKIIVMEVDHILAFSKGGGEFDMDNLISACNICNGRWSNHDKPQHIFDAVSKLAMDRNRVEAI